MPGIRAAFLPSIWCRNSPAGKKTEVFLRSFHDQRAASKQGNAFSRKAVVEGKTRKTARVKIGLRALTDDANTTTYSPMNNLQSTLGYLSRSWFTMLIAGSCSSWTQHNNSNWKRRNVSLILALTTAFDAARATSARLALQQKTGRKLQAPDRNHLTIFENNRSGIPNCWCPRHYTRWPRVFFDEF